MERLVFADAWQEFFGRHRLKTFSQFFHGLQGLCVNRNSKRNVLKLTVKDPSARTFFLKRFYRSQFKDTLGAVWRFGRPMSQAAVEWTNVHHLQGHGIRTCKPVCFGEQMTLGFERRSFLLTEQVKGVCMANFLAERWRGLDRAGRERIVVEMARLARRMYDVNVSLPDLYVWHLFIRPDPTADGYALSVIDLHRMVPKAWTTPGRLKSLVRLHWSMSPRYFDDELKELLVSTYNEDGRIDLDYLARSIRDNARTLERRGRNIDLYYAQALACQT
jgi:hypothetical protein